MPDSTTPRFCPQCGEPVSPTAKFCGNCGHLLQSTSTSTPEGNADAGGSNAMPNSESRGAGPTPTPAPAPQPTVSPTSEPASVPDPKPPRSRRGLAVGIAIACVAGVVAIGLIGWWFFASTGPEPVTVPITINAEGYSDECTAIPIQVDGTDEGGGAVSETAFVGGGESGLSLRPGSYTLSFPASPLTPSGVVYNLPEEPLTIDIVLGEDGSPQISGNEAVTFTPSTALDETDEMIQTAYEWALKDPDQKERAEELHEKALQVHKEAVDQKNADKEAKRQEEEAARQAEEERQRQEEEARQADPLNQIQGSWSGYMTNTFDWSERNGAYSVVIDGNMATFYWTPNNGSESTRGPYAIHASSESALGYEMSFPTDEYQGLWLLYSPSDPSTLACVVGSDGTDVAIMTRS